jgi:crotonobetainyl-CoA:carnitine CoA-transferase CaiB-like acyl-CoA transferase
VAVGYGDAVPGALDGIVVADFSRVLAGPFATMLLGDLGADVVKVERPGAGDDTRGWGPPFVDGESAYYLAVNRNKRSVAVDLSTAEGRAVARELALRADVLVENFKPGTMSRLGLGYEELSAENPRLVWCSVSGFGTTGEGAAMPGYDFLVQAVGGLMSITGQPGAEPTKVGVAVVDVLTGLFAATGILASLHHRERTGEGQKVEVDLLSSLLGALVNQASTYVTTGIVPQAMGNRHPSITPYESLHAKDRPLIVAVGNDGQFATFAERIGAGWLAGDDRFRTNAARVTNREELVAAVEEALAARTAEEWVAVLAEAGVPCGLVNDIGEAFALAERLGLGPVVEIARAGSERVRQVANPIRLSASPVSYRLAPPRLGADTEAVLGTSGPPG